MIAVWCQNEILDGIVKLYTTVVDLFILMDNNMHPHTDDIIDDFPDNEEIAHTEWLTYSLHHNVIKISFVCLGFAVCRCLPPSTTLRDLETALHEKEQLLNSALHLVTSMIACFTLYMQMKRGSDILCYFL